MDFTPRCPICRVLVPWDGNAFRPFCSERCQLIDLGGWSSERYRIRSAPIEAPTGDSTPADDDAGEPEPS